MSITKQELEKACRRVAKDMVLDPGGWLDNITTVIFALKAPEMANLPIVAEKLALLNTLISFVNALGDAKKFEPKSGELKDYFSNPRKAALFMVTFGLEEIKSRIENQINHIDQLLTTGYGIDQKTFLSVFNGAAINMVSSSHDSFVSKVIVPGVILTGEKRLPLIKDDAMATYYCQQLLKQSKIFNIYDSSDKGQDSVEKILNDTFKTMATRVQDIYWVLNQPIGLQQTVYIKPPLKVIKRCIVKYQEQICGKSAKEETIATRGYVSNRAKVLYLYAWNLEVTLHDGVVIQVLQNPQSAVQIINTGIVNNMLAHLEELVSTSGEQLAWQETISTMG